MECKYLHTIKQTVLGFLICYRVCLPVELPENRQQGAPLSNPYQAAKGLLASMATIRPLP